MKTYLKKIFAIGVVLFGTIIFGFIFLRSAYYVPSDEITLSKPVELAIAEQTSAFLKNDPINLSIPKIGVDAHIEKVGITKKGNMATPNNFFDVGWYKYGTIPGEKGSAVIAGHVNDGWGLPAVFGGLSNLEIGDDIYILREDNIKLHFKVNKIDTYDFNASSEKVFNDDSGKLLKLITCTGNWINQLKTHDKRLVVSAILVE